MGILWDEKQLTTINPEEILKEMSSIYSEFRKELAANSIASTGSIFIGVATEDDSELIKSLLKLPAELRSGLLNYIQTYVTICKEETKIKTSISEDENTVRNEKLKELLLAFPYKDIEIFIDRPLESGRDIQL